jgi:hypothetical protein
MKRTITFLAAVVFLAACGVGATGEATTSPGDTTDFSLTPPTDQGSDPTPATTDQPPVSTTETTESQPKPSPTTTSPESGTGDNLAAPMTGLVEAAIKDLANRLSIEVSTITLIEASEVTWPNSSVGCPQPNMSYLQVLTPGSLIKLESGGVTYEYHAGPSGPPFYCATPTPPSEGGGGTGDY